MSEHKKIKEWDIHTPSGWCDFSGIKKTYNQYLTITFVNSNHILKASLGHLVKFKGGGFDYVDILLPGDILEGGLIVKEISFINEKINLFDLTDVNNDNEEYISENITHHNCAFIEGIEEIWAASSQTLATGGGAIVLSTPYGTGNWFHREWVKATARENQFIPIKLPWSVHPERDQAWRDRQDEILGDPRIAAQECDCTFSTSGDTVFYPELLGFYETTLKDPIERRGVDKNLWIWEPADYSRSYLVTADVARGDSKDYSAFHVIDIESNTQVAEYKGQIGTKEFGNLLVGIASEYNGALLVVENSNIGWSTVQTILDRGYPNLYYSTKGEDKMDASSYFSKFDDKSSQVPGFTMSLRTRPNVLSKFQEYINGKSVTFYSKRLLEEMRVFIWKNGRAEAQTGYNDDLIMSFSIAMYLRDTSLKFRNQGDELTKAALNNISVYRYNYRGEYRSSNQDNPYQFKVNGQDEDISWLLK